MFVQPFGNFKEIGPSPESTTADLQSESSFGETLSRELAEREDTQTSEMGFVAISSLANSESHTSAGVNSASSQGKQPDLAATNSAGTGFDTSKTVNNTQQASSGRQAAPDSALQAQTSQQISADGQASRLQAGQQMQSQPAGMDQLNARLNQIMATLPTGELSSAAQPLRTQSDMAQPPARVGSTKPSGQAGQSASSASSGSSSQSAASELIKTASIQPQQAGSGAAQSSGLNDPGLSASEVSVDSEATFQLAPSSTDTPDVETSAMTQRAEMQNIQQSRPVSASQLPQFISQTGQKLLERFDGKTSSFEIRLDPAELGKVDVRIKVDADGRVQAVLAAQDPNAADALTRGLRSLENALTQAGLSLSEHGVQIELAKNGRDQSAANQQTDEGSTSSSGHETDSEEMNETGPYNITPEVQVWSRSRLDLRA